MIARWLLLLSLLHICCAAEETQSSTTITPRRPITIITSCNSVQTYWDRLRNFIGSVHFWEPELPIKLYDLGMTKQQRSIAEEWMNVEIRTFPFENYPPHFKIPRQFAWKPIVMRDALQHDNAILYLDAGEEIRRPIDEVIDIIYEHGYFYVVQEGLHTQNQCCGQIGELCVDGTFEALGLKREEYGHNVMCAGGIQGYINGSRAYNEVLLPTIECAMRRVCIAPEGAGLYNHRFDQAVFSLYIAKGGYHCQRDSKFWANFVNTWAQGVSVDPTKSNRIILMSRRGFKGNNHGFYYDFIQKKPPQLAQLPPSTPLPQPQPTHMPIPYSQPEPSTTHPPQPLAQPPTTSVISQQTQHEETREEELQQGSPLEMEIRRRAEQVRELGKQIGELSQQRRKLKRDLEVLIKGLATERNDSPSGPSLLDNTIFQ